MMKNMAKNNVIVVGGGMVGAAMAIKLAQQGKVVRVIEKHPIDAPQVLNSDDVDIRVSAINRFSEKLLDQLGAMPLLRANRLAPYEQLETFERSNDHLLFDCHAINTTHLGHLIENKLIQASLWQQFHILSYDQMVSPKINNQTTRCANSIFYTTLFTNTALNYT